MGETSTGRFSWWVALSVVLIVAATGLVYSNSMHVPFLLDDLAAIKKNTTLRQLHLLWPVLLYPPGDGNTVQGRPVLNLSFALNYAWGGLDVFGYHLANVAIHAAAALVLFGVVRRTLLLPGMPASAQGRAPGLALVVALVWAVHPLQTAAVTYVAQRAESLAGLWYLLTLYGLVIGSQSQRRWPWYALSVLCCAAGMATKETLVTAPPLLLLYDRAFLSPSFRQALRERAFLYAGLFMTWGVVAYLALSGAGRGGTAGFGAGVSPWEYLCTQFGFVARYLCLCFWPGPLVFDYGTPLATEASEVVPYAAVVVALAAAALVAFRYSPAVGFLGVAFFLLLAPSSSIVPVATQTAAEHRMYLALAPVVLLVVLAADWAARRWSLGAVPVVAAVAVVATLGVRTYLRNFDYQTEQGIWEDVVQKWPTNHRAHLGLSGLAFRAGDYEGALRELDEVARLRPDDWEAYFHRSKVLQALGRVDESARELERALELDRTGVAYVERAERYLLAREFDLALADLTEAIRRGAHADKLNLRAQVSLAAGRPQDALVDLNEAVRLAPDRDLYRHNRGDLYIKLGMAARAREDLDEAVRLNGTRPATYLLRAQLRLTGGDLAGAGRDLDRAEELEADQAPLQYTRALWYWHRKELGPAVEALNVVVRLRPEWWAAYRLRAMCHLGRGDRERAREDAATVERLGGKVDPKLAERLQGP